jgi:hypothetical protein
VAVKHRCILEKIYSCTTRPDLFTDSDDTCESIFIEISNYFKRKTVVGCLYRAPNNDMRLFNENLAGLLHKLDKEHASCVIAGDYNINLLNSEVNSDTTSFVFLICLFLLYRGQLVIPIIMAL